MKKETITKIISFTKDYDDLEIEFRLGNKYTDTFSTNITKKNYDIIMNKLEKSHKKGIFTKEVKNINDFFIKGERISIIDEKIISIVKKKLFKEDFKLDNSPMDIRLSVSREIKKEIVDDFDEDKIDEIFKRNKLRTTYGYKNWKYELTEVVTCKNCVNETSYEFELEIDFSGEDTEKLLESSYKKIFDVIGFIKDS